MNRTMGFILPLLALFVVLYAPTTSAESAEDTQEQAHPQDDHERNDIGVFLGITTGGEEVGGGKEDATGTIGVDYRRRLSRRIGVGFLVEFSGGERRDHVGLVPLTFWLSPRAQLIVGAGWERSGSEVFGGKSEFLGRLGFGYSIELLPRNTIRPEINVDFVDGEQLVVVGASIGWGF